VRFQEVPLHVDGFVRFTGFLNIAFEGRDLSFVVGGGLGLG
jgi:hypothetical protein